MAWRFYIDGDDVTNVAFGKSVTRRLNRPASAKCRIPSDLTTVEAGSSRLKVYDDSNGLWFHGIVYYLEDEGDEDTAYTDIIAYDPMILWKDRPARDSDGDFSYPTFWTSQSTGPQILKYVLQSSETWEGPLFLDLTGGVVQTGGFDLSALPLDYPMTIADVWGLLADTGAVDVVIDPIDMGANIGRLNGYNGDYGDDLSGSVVFQWGTGAKNVRAIKRSHDMSTLCNKLYYYGGPKVQTVSDPDATQHWRTNITGDHPTLATASFNPPGGSTTNGSPLGTAAVDSRANNWVAMDIRTYDTGYDNATDDPAAQAAVDLMFMRLWQKELQARVNGKTMVSITPTRGTQPDFGIGDLITVQAGARLRGGFSGTQRVYELTVNIDDDGVTEIGEIVASADQES